jgi:hypothetical protein
LTRQQPELLQLLLDRALQQAGEVIWVDAHGGEAARPTPRRTMAHRQPRTVSATAWMVANVVRVMKSFVQARNRA